MKKSMLQMAVLVGFLVVISAGNAAVLYPAQDTYTSVSGGCFGTLDYVLIGNFPSHGHDEQGLLSFDLSSYAGQPITSATLFFKRFTGCGEDACDIDIYDVTVAWDETYSGVHIAHGATVWGNVVVSTNGWFQVDITSLVQGWLNNDIPNYGLVMAPKPNSGDTKFSSREAAENKRPYLVIEGGATPSPTPTPFVPDNTCAMICMPGNYFKAGDTFSCSVSVYNMETAALAGYPLFVVLDVYGSYFFAPSFTAFDSYLALHPTFEPGLTSVEVLPEFAWPNGVGEAENVRWISGLTNPAMTELFGEVDVFSFGWGE
jgi:hypothetical protein